MLLQLIRANHPTLTANLLRSNLLAWNEYHKANPLAEDRTIKNFQDRHYIQDDLPWEYILDVNGDAYCIDVSDLLISVDRLDNALFDLNPNDASSTTVSDPESDTVVPERIGSFALKTRDLITSLQSASTKPEPFLEILPSHAEEIKNILASVNDRVSGAKSLLTQLKAGETTDIKRQQVHTFASLDALLYGIEIQSLEHIHKSINTKDSVFSVFQSKLPNIGKSKGNYFFLDVDVDF